jgi:putative addiction module antidote
MNGKIRRIGNSLGVLVPAAMTERLGLEEGDEVVLDAEAGRLVVTPKQRAERAEQDIDATIARLVDENAESLRRLAR